MKRSLLPVLALAFPSVSACTPPPSVSADPTWADVEPVLRGECVGCHGSSAPITGGGYRLDFFDMTSGVCGAAAQALAPNTLLAGAAAPFIRVDVTSPSNGDRPRMPPAPAPALEGWERVTLQRWAMQPSKGPPPEGNRLPNINVGALPRNVNGHLQFTAVTADPDDDPVIGVLQIGGSTFLMNRSGAFSIDLDTSGWISGTQRLSAVLCDGWASVTYDLGPIQVQH
jgi:hypothetical protein